MLSPDDLVSYNRFVRPDGGWAPDDLARCLAELEPRSPAGAWSVIGRSREGREIRQVTLGDGPQRVLAWSQMHGDEPTHTTVLLNLIDFLLRGEHAAAREILSNCTLGLILMLNPDGSLRRQRPNADGVDINRDARRFATPEGRALRDAVRDFTPRFGFNLHNQRRRRRLADRAAPASISLLVPPVDTPNTATEATRAAAQVAAAIKLATAPHTDGRISRFGADYMPRAFGEWVQNQGVATVLIEAGGWPGHDVAALEHAHLHAFAAGLESIATGACLDADPQEYETLQRSSDGDLFDLLITNARLLEDDDATQRVDLGVGLPHFTAMLDDRTGGRIEEVGDLAEQGAFETLDAAGGLGLPGRIAVVAGDDGDLPSDEQLIAAARQGVTTAVAPFDPSKPAARESFLQRLEQSAPPIDVVPVLLADRGEPTAEQIDFAHELRLWAIVGETDAQPHASTLKIDRQTLDSWSLAACDSPSEWRSETARRAALLGLNDRDVVGLDKAAYLVVAALDGEQPARIAALRAVVVAGTLVSRDASAEAPANERRWSGSWLRRDVSPRKTRT
ncbi:Zinc carboxypeptidase [Pseudobythopirellula maris]|uniref:Zinc carboxypeptidase n=1 Tax=Pseudobythopirellula maris TaxID=2527991 RepID=A0A5C5ZIL8_9BACT|nr:M14 family zinc carboxypeptidase [Pseudobythopirellula maris]TWT87232.1 Zinc carboxypeptidase [Pseudobythopirellula maris]